MLIFIPLALIIIVLFLIIQFRRPILETLTNHDMEKSNFFIFVDGIDTLLARNNKTKLIAIPIVLFGLLFLFNSFYTVAENEQAVITMFGTVQRTEGAGVHFKIPFLQKAKIVDISTHGASIGYQIDGSTQIYGNSENPQMITSDFNLINVDFYLEYKINDPIAFLYNSQDPERILNDMAMSAIRATISDFPVDDVMTTAKGQIQQRIKESLIKELETRNIGLQVINIMIQDVEPPTESVMNAFKSVETAKQGADTAINNAKKYQSEQLPKAEAEADRIIQASEAKKQARIAEAEGQVARFNKMYEEYVKYPNITKQRIFYETMEDLLPDVDVIITDGNTQSYVPISQLNGGN